MNAYLNGLILSLGLILAIGAQNAFVIQQGLARSFVFTVALTSAVCDALLILIGVFGAGAVVMSAPWLSKLLSAAGFIFLSRYGLRTLKAAFSPHPISTKADEKVSRNWSTQALQAMSFSLLNPHAIIDTVVMIGGASTRYISQSARFEFAGGAATASFIWFFSLAYGARAITPVFQNVYGRRILDGVIAIMMLSLAGSLLFALIR